MKLIQLATLAPFLGAVLATPAGSILARNAAPRCTGKPRSQLQFFPLSTKLNGPDLHPHRIRCVWGIDFTSERIQVV
ncbi:hypothetical protein C8R45DRAFT_986390 [Mycena sanguinolenta]|nr:hypothetical protein C8R45DRAFT_986390 [Mycena sanguinolenta]